jgi:hypothetical protein
VVRALVERPRGGRFVVHAHVGATLCLVIYPALSQRRLPRHSVRGGQVLLRRCVLAAHVLMHELLFMHERILRIHVRYLGIPCEVVVHGAPLYSKWERTRDGGVSRR